MSERVCETRREYLFCSTVAKGKLKGIFKVFMTFHGVVLFPARCVVFQYEFDLMPTGVIIDWRCYSARS